MTSESDERAPLSAQDLADMRGWVACGLKLGLLDAKRLLDEVSTLRAKLAEAERAWEQHESGDVSCSWHELATGQTIEAERAKAERDAANARAAEAERLLLELRVAIDKHQPTHGPSCVCVQCEGFKAAKRATRSHLQSLKAKEPKP